MQSEIRATTSSSISFEMHLPLFDVLIESSTLSSSLSMCGNEPLMQNSGMEHESVSQLLPPDAFNVSVIHAFPFLWSFSILFDILLSAYRPLPDLFFVTMSRRRKPHFGEPFGLSIARFVGLPVVFRHTSSSSLYGNVSTSNGTRLMACSTPINRLCSNCGNSSASISNAIGVNESRYGSSVR